MTPPSAPTFRRSSASRRIRIIVFAILVSTCLLQSRIQFAYAQGSPEHSADEVVRVSTDLVTIPFNVTDGRGRRVAGLAQRDFETFDNGQRVETSYFAAGAEHVALLFLLDASGSTRDIIAQQRETALAIFSHFGEGSRLAVMQFREQPELTLPFTTELRRARRAFQIAALPDRHTAIFDAALAAVRAFDSSAQQPDDRRIVILVSDGLDTSSATLPAAVINEARAAGISFYVLHIPLFEPRDGKLIARRPAKGFRDLASKTGGQLFVIGDARTSLDPRAEHDLRSIFLAISDDLRSQYVIGYHASAADSRAGLHRVEVRLAKRDSRKLRVHQLRDGYQSKGNFK